MAITEIYSGTNTIPGGTSGGYGWSLAGNTMGFNFSGVTTPAVVQLVLDTSDSAAGYTHELTIRDKVTSGGIQKIIYTAVLDGAQSGVFTTPGFILYHGWDIQLLRTEFPVGGLDGDATFSWSIRKIG